VNSRTRAPIPGAPTAARDARGVERKRQKTTALHATGQQQASVARHQLLGAAFDRSERMTDVVLLRVATSPYMVLLSVASAISRASRRRRPRRDIGTVRTRGADVKKISYFCIRWSQPLRVTIDFHARMRLDPVYDITIIMTMI
jgi:hypothetical protein